MLLFAIYHVFAWCRFFVRTRITDFIRAVKWNVRFRNEHQELLLPIVNWVSGELRGSRIQVGFMEVIRNVCCPHNKVPAQGSPGLSSQPLFPSQRKTFIPSQVSMLALCELSESLVTRWIDLSAPLPAFCSKDSFSKVDFLSSCP